MTEPFLCGYSYPGSIWNMFLPHVYKIWPLPPTPMATPQGSSQYIVVFWVPLWPSFMALTNTVLPRGLFPWAILLPTCLSCCSHPLLHITGQPWVNLHHQGSSRMFCMFPPPDSFLSTSVLSCPISHLLKKIPIDIKLPEFLSPL